MKLHSIAAKDNTAIIVAAALVFFLGVTVTSGFAQSGDGSIVSAMENDAAGEWKPEIVQDELPNGVRILYSRVNDIPLAEISIIIDAGLTRESDELPGVSYATNQQLFGASADRTGEMIERRLDDLGTVVVPYVHYDYAQLYAKTLTRNFGSTLEILSDALMNPLFPEQAWAVFQKQTDITLARPSMSAGERASRIAVAAVCGVNSAFTRPLLPAASEISKLSTADVKDFHARWYRPANTTVIISGDLDYKFIRTLLIEAFGRWAPVTAEVDENSTATPMGAGMRIADDRSGNTKVVHVRMSMPSVARGSTDFAALMVLNGLLSDGKDARLRKALWGDHVISPTFTSTLGIARGCNYCMIAGTVSPALVDSAVQVIMNSLEQLRDVAVEEEELARVKNVIQSDSPLMFSSNRSMLAQMKEIAVHGLSVPDIMGYTDQIAVVTAEDVRRVARFVFDPAKIAVSVAANSDVLLPRLRNNGEGWDVISE